MDVINLPCTQLCVNCY